MTKLNYSVTVGNVGTVHNGSSKKAAEKVYRDYVKVSKSDAGWAAGEDVTLFEDDEPVREFKGSLRPEQCCECFNGDLLFLREVRRGGKVVSAWVCDDCGAEHECNVEL